MSEDYTKIHFQAKIQFGEQCTKIERGGQQRNENLSLFLESIAINSILGSSTIR